MQTVKLEYISLRKLALKYDLHPDTIKKKDLVEGIHYVKIGKLSRYHIKNMHILLTGNTLASPYSLDRFLIN